MIFRKFLVRLILLGATLVLSAATFNIVIDPYALFEVWRKPGINDAKPMAATRLRTSKPYQLMRANPKTLIAGNSRPELGMDPQSTCWKPDERPIYNAGIPGVGIYQQARVIQGALLQGDTRRVLWGLDFLDFVSAQQGGPLNWPLPPSELDRRLPVTADGEANAGYRLQWLRDVRDATLSLDALTDSVSTLIQADALYGSTRRSDGFNPARDYVGIVKSEGQGVLFEQKNLEVMQRLSQGQLQLYAPNREWSQAFESVRFILALAQREGVQIELFINPYHADYLAAIELSGNWSLLEKWKRSLTTLAADFEGALLWDFNGLDRYSSQILTPDMQTGDSLAWYWEPAHYRAELGERLIARINDTDCDGNLDTGLGALLTPASIGDHLAGLRGQLRGFANRYPAHWRRLAARYQAVLESKR